MDKIWSRPTLFFHEYPISLGNYYHYFKCHFMLQEHISSCFKIRLKISTACVVFFAWIARKVSTILGEDERSKFWPTTVCWFGADGLFGSRVGQMCWWPFLYTFSWWWMRCGRSFFGSCQSLRDYWQFSYFQLWLLYIEPLLEVFSSWKIFIQG